METQKHMEERLWDFIDGRCTAAEKSLVEKLLETDPGWKEKYHALLDAHRLLQSADLEEPSLRFTKNVMEDIVKFHIAPAAKNYINTKIIWGLGLFFITLVTGFLIYGFRQIEWNNPGKTSLPVDFSKVDYSRIFSNTYVNIFMMINVVLGLFLLDNYLNSKRKKFKKA
jgi:hypothetical protein